MKHKDLAVDYFERHSTSNECHITSDGRVFHASGNAISFANEHNLQDQTIESYTREQFEQMEDLSFTAEVDTTAIENSLDVIKETLEKGADDVNNTDDVTTETENEIAEKENIEENQVVDSKIEELKNFDIATGDYQDVKSFIKHFEIETADQKAETLKTALTEYKNNLAQ